MASLAPALVVILGCASAASAQGLDVEQRYLRALAIAAEGKLGPASEELELLARRPSALADRCAWQAGLLFERRGALRKAAGLFGAVSERSFYFLQAQLALARVRRLNGELGQAVAALAPLTSSPVRKRALLELAALAELARDEPARREAMGQLAVARAPWLGGAPVLAIITRSYDPLLQRNACRDARRAARRASREPGCASQLLAAEASACMGADVAAGLRRLVRDCPRPELAARAWMTLGMSQAREGAVDASAASFREVARAAPATRLAAEALFAAFWVGWKASPAPPTGEDLARLEALPIELNAQDRARVGYWRARVAEARGGAAEAGTLLGEVALLYPATWYGHLARTRLETLGVSGAPKVALADVLPEQSDDAHEREALERLGPALAAVRLGLEDGASELVMLARREPSAASNRLAIEVLNAAGESALAYRFARAVVREQAGRRQDAAVWREAFPTHFSTLLAQQAEETNVTHDLLQGLVREESSFDPQARSHCGALGLMQLMPATARAVARELGGVLAHPRELLEPERNVQLGARYLGRLLRRFDGNRAAAAAAYNGGPSRVAGWLKVANAGRLEEWVEELPLDETRNYVKDVLASADVYRYRFAERSLIASAAP